MIKNTRLYPIVILLFIITVTNVFSQKLTKEEVNSKLTKSWSATETGAPGEALSPKENKEIMDFKPDGSLTMEQYSSMMGSMTFEVLWEFDEANQKLILTLTNEGMNETQELEILELTDEKLVLVTVQKQTVYIPTEDIKQEATSEIAIATVETTNEELNPDTWSGKLNYNIVVMVDDKDNQSEERVPGVITLEKLGENRIIRKNELDNTVIWTVESEMEIANMIHYSVVNSDQNLNGEISFQNGFILLEIYEPKYYSYLWAVE